MNDLTPARPAFCGDCGVEIAFPHDHKPDQSGLDDGPPLRAERKKPLVKPSDAIAEIRRKAWETRRERYGKYGHR